jgi:hypothetical protein
MSQMGITMQIAIWIFGTHPEIQTESHGMMADAAITRSPTIVSGKRSATSAVKEVQNHAVAAGSSWLESTVQKY